MSNIASVLKEEIRRAVAKELKASKGASEVASLKRELAAVQRELAKVQKSQGRKSKAAAGTAAPAGKPGRKKKVARKTSKKAAASSDGDTRRRFSADGVRKHREKLGLSAADYAKLVGVSALTIYNWEHGKSRPRVAQLDSLAAVRSLGKREADAKLAEGPKAE